MRALSMLHATHEEEETRVIACTISGTSSPPPASLAEAPPPEKLSTEATSPRGKLACQSGTETRKFNPIIRGAVRVQQAAHLQ